VPRQQHYYGLNHLHFLTSNIYTRARIFDSERFKLKFVRTSDDLRAELSFLNIWSEKKRLEKLNYMHNNPVKRGLVAQPGDWPWSSWRFYYLGDRSVLAMDTVR
jgi:REP element-mobilizing transposase RayT